jgi:beta-lactam-binding protein with PASTA domain
MVLKALAKEPADRYPSAEIMKQAMAGYRQLGEQTTAPVKVAELPSSRRYQSTGIRPVSAKRIDTRKRGVDWFVITLAVLILGFTVASIPVAAKVYELYFNSAPVEVAPTGTPHPPPTRVPPTPAPTNMPRASVPSVVGLAYAEAKILLESNDLQIRSIEEFSEKVQSSLVISQTIKPGADVPIGSVIDVVISKGPELIAVPKVVDDVLNEAVRKLQALRFDVKVKEEHNDRAAIGTVIKQEPAPSSRVPKGSKVDITVSLGRPPTATPEKPENNENVFVPSLVGLTQDEAQRRIQSAGLGITYPNYQGPGDISDGDLQKVPPGYVLSQQPPAGKEVKRGETVFIAVRKN